MNKSSLFRQIMTIVTLCTVTVFVLISTLSTLIFRKTAIDTLHETNDHILSQLNNSYDMLYEQIIDVIVQLSLDYNVRARMTRQPADAFEHYQMQRYVNDYLQTFSGFTGLNGIDIILCGQNGETYSNNSQMDPLMVKAVLKEPFVQEAARDYRALGFSPARFGVTSTTRDTRYFFIAKGLYNPYVHRFFGTLLFIIDESCFNAHYRSFDKNGNLYALVDDHGVVLSATDSALNHTSSQELLELALHPGDQGRFGGGQYIVQSAYNPYFRFHTVLLSDRSLILARMGLPAFLSVGLCALVLFMEGLMVLAYVRRVTHPITALAQVMNGSIRENIVKPPRLRGKFASCAESEELTAAYEHMSGELHTYIGELITEQEARRIAEMNALQYQINPHFLYNTLTSIKYLSFTRQTEAVEVSINALIRVLRKTIGDVRNLIPLIEEIEITESYFAIQSLRYSDRIRLNVHPLTGLEAMPVPKLILQPIVENSIFHAFSEEMEDCAIDIFFTRTPGGILIELIDNGQGIPPETLSRILKGKKSTNRSGLNGIGIGNVDERIKLLYGDGYGVKVTSALGIGTQVRLTLPCEEEERGESGHE